MLTFLGAIHLKFVYLFFCILRSLWFCMCVNERQSVEENGASRVFRSFQLPPTPLSPAKQTAGKAGYDFCIQHRWMLKDHQAPSLYPRRCAIRDLKQRHFWETQVNRKCLDAKDVLVWFLYTCRDNLTENLGKTTAQECKKTTSGWRASLKNAFA